MRAQHTRYVVPGWGVGELWTSNEAVLAHEFEFGPTDGAALAAAAGATLPAAGDDELTPAARSELLAAAPHEGAARPPTGTVRGEGAPMGHGFAPTSQHASERPTAIDAAELVERLRAFLTGAADPLADVPLDLAGYAQFQQAVARFLRGVPRGEVVSYGELAALAGYPGAQRAVGMFCARNRFSFLLPCHRVVAANGIGGYGRTGVAVKRRLLALEGIVL